MLDLLLSPLIFGPICLALGGLIGVGLGRRSETANDFYDGARAEWGRREAQLQAKIDALKAKHGEK